VTSGVDIDVLSPMLHLPGDIKAQGNYYVQVVSATDPHGETFQRSERVTFPNIVLSPAQVEPFLERVPDVYVAELPLYQSNPVQVRPFGTFSSNGTLEDPEVWVGRIEIIDDLFVLGDLTILPGTEIVIKNQAPGSELSIHVFSASLYRGDGAIDEVAGRIRSIGSPALPIRFHAEEPGGGGWEGLRLVGESSFRRSELAHTIIQDTWIGLDLITSEPVIRNCTVELFNDIGIHMTNIMSTVDQSLLEQAVSELRHGDDVVDSEITNPFGVARPLIRACVIRGTPDGRNGDFGIFSQDSRARIENTAIHHVRHAAVMIRGTHVPDLDGGGNDFSMNFRTNLQNSTQIPFPATANFWGIPGDFTSGGFDDLPVYYIDESIIDDDENGNFGRVQFMPALNERPSRIVEFGDLNGDSTIDSADLQEFLSRWGSVIGSPKYRVEADFDRDRAVDERDFFFFAGQWLSSEK
jgi:hypothetical protein